MMLGPFSKGNRDAAPMQLSCAAIRSLLCLPLPCSTNISHASLSDTDSVQRPAVTVAVCQCVGWRPVGPWQTGASLWGWEMGPGWTMRPWLGTDYHDDTIPLSRMLHFHFQMFEIPMEFQTNELTLRVLTLLRGKRKRILLSKGPKLEGSIHSVLICSCLYLCKVI